MAQTRYLYELRQGDRVTSTGHLTLPVAVQVGERIAIGGSVGLVRAVEPLLGDRALRLIVQLLPVQVELSDESPSS
jgi:hypothetical protein